MKYKKAINPKRV